MSEYEKQLRERFDLPMEGNLCDRCVERLGGKIVIDYALKKNASAQASLGTDSTESDRRAAHNMARHAKTTIAEISPKIAEECFPEIDLKTLPADAYLGEKL